MVILILARSTALVVVSASIKSHCTIHKRNLIPIILERSRQIERYTLFPRVLKKEKEILEVVLNQR